MQTSIIRVLSRSLCMDALPSIDCADRGRLLLFPFRHHRFTWRAVGAEPQPSLCENVPGRVLVSVECGSTALAAEESAPFGDRPVRPPHVEHLTSSIESASVTSNQYQDA